MRTQRIIRWGIAIVLALIFVGSAIPKLMGSAGMAPRFEAWGYPSAFSVMIGVVEIVGGLMVLIPRVAFLGGALLSLDGDWVPVVRIRRACPSRQSRLAYPSGVETHRGRRPVNSMEAGTTRVQLQAEIEPLRSRLDRIGLTVGRPNEIPYAT